MAWDQTICVPKYKILISVAKYSGNGFLKIQTLPVVGHIKFIGSQISKLCDI